MQTGSETMALPRNIDSYLTRRFYDKRLPGSFTSVTKLHSVLKKEGRYRIPLERVKEWAKGQDIVTLHKTVRERQPAYRRIITPGPGHLWDCDLLVLNGRRFTESNSGKAYILITVDVFSRFCRAEAVKNKGAREMERAFTRIFDRTQSPPRYLRSDHGTEFSNEAVQRLLKEKGVHHYFANTETKANYSEILIKTIKKKLFQFFQRTNSYAYEKDLQNIIKSYNNTVHSSIGVAPSEVGPANQQAVWDYQYVTNSSSYRKVLKRALKAAAAGGRRRQGFKYAVGQTVRVASFKRKPFDRAYDEQFNGEVFTVRSRRLDEGIPLYYLTDYGGEEVAGHFYQGEITPVRYDPDALFKIEKVLKTRVRGGVEEKLVKYQSWPSRYNQWIATKALVDIKGGGKKKARKRRR